MTTVVVTGIGATTPLGGTAKETWANALAGKSGIVTMPYEWIDTLPVHFAGVAVAEPLDQGLEPVKARRLDRSQQFAIVAGSPRAAGARAAAVAAGARLRADQLHVAQRGRAVEEHQRDRGAARLAAAFPLRPPQPPLPPPPAPPPRASRSAPRSINPPPAPPPPPGAPAVAGHPGAQAHALPLARATMLPRRPREDLPAAQPRAHRCAGEPGVAVDADARAHRHTRRRAPCAA